jgi:hypothetical protein
MEPNAPPPAQKKPIPWLEIILILVLVLMIIVSVNALFGEAIAAEFQKLCTRYEFLCP